MPEPQKGFLRTSDNLNLAYEHERIGSDRLVIVCPGFFNSMRNRWLRLISQILAREYDVLTFDFRGHGNSSGRFSWTAREDRDLEAVLEHARSFNYSAIGILGLSLGAAIAINTVSRAGGVQSMVLISAPISFWEINYHFWEPAMFSDLFDNFECGWEGKGVRAGNFFLRKLKPIIQIKQIKDVPILFIHGTKDWIIKDYHSQRLYDAYEAPAGLKELVIIKGGLHGERLVQQDKEKMAGLILGWFRKTLGG